MATLSAEVLLDGVIFEARAFLATHAEAFRGRKIDLEQD